MQLLLSYTRADFNALASLVVARHFYPQGRVYLVGRPEPKTRALYDQIVSGRGVGHIGRG